MLSAALAMDAEIERTGTAYRALSMPFYSENLLAQLGAIREQGTFSLAFAADRPLASVATRDIAVNAAALLADRSWAGQERVPVFGPDRISPDPDNVAGCRIGRHPNDAQAQRFSGRNQQALIRRQGLVPTSP